MRVRSAATSMELDVAIVGTGPDPVNRDRQGFAMAYRHAQAYQEREDCRIVACADIERDHAAAFAEHHDVSPSAVYTDHQTMLREARPDVVSVCVPPTVHAEIVLDCARLGATRAIHCEKPMATRWEDCRDMVAVCAEENVQLTIDHQRRFASPVRRAKELVDGGDIGDVRRLEWSEVNLFDAGSHVFDLCDLFVDGARPAWVLGAVDATEEQRWFGALNSTRAIVHWAYENGVHGIASTADGGETAIDAYLRIVGEDGEIEIQPKHGPPLRMRTDGGWTAVDTDGESLYGPKGSKVRGAIGKVRELAPGNAVTLPQRPNYGRAIDHAIESLIAGREPTISGATALRSTELIFGAWESARARARVDIPIGDVGNPLEAMIERESAPLADAD